MKNNMLKKILSIALVVLLSGIIPSTAAFAANIIADGDCDIKTSADPIVNLGEFSIGDTINHRVRVYAKTGGVSPGVAEVKVNAPGGSSVTPRSI